jgi:multidrug transporter EmrE-like cation transporter
VKILLINLFLLAALSISSLGDIFAKTWTMNRKPALVVAALVLYMIASSLWIFWLQYAKLSVALVWWQSFGAILTLLISIFYFKEKLSLIEGLAVALVLSGILLLNFQHLLKSGT